MTGWFGTDTFGEVERLEDEAVVTEFVQVILPCWPRTSYYLHRTDEGVIATPIPLHRTSVVAGLVRTPAWLAALIVGLPGLVDPARWGYLLPFAAVLAGVAAWVTFRLGRLSGPERERRALLRRVVGFGAPPEMVSPPERLAIRDALDQRWRRGRDDESWADAIVAGVADELLVALAEYHARPALAAQARDNLRVAAERWN
jgi:hypothetical protein